MFLAADTVLTKSLLDTLVDLGAVGFMLLGGFLAWWLMQKRNHKNGATINERLLNAFRQREEFIQQMINHQGQQTEALRQISDNQRDLVGSLNRLADKLSGRGML